MKQPRPGRPAPLLLPALLLMALGCTPPDDLNLLVGNPLNLSRQDELICLVRDSVLPRERSTRNLQPVVLGPDGVPLPSQTDDLDLDGSWDELVFLVDLAPGEQKELTISFDAGTATHRYPVRTNIRLGANLLGYPDLRNGERLEGVSYHNYEGKTSAHFLMEGPAWENDRVGFRNYLDQRNGMDIYGKRTRRMVLDSVGLPGGPSYHEAAEWGMDILKVGTSLGAGGLACLAGDSLYRVGDRGRGDFRILSEGPVRSSLRAPG
ncbi:MAG: DUF4861 family protein [Bacteroidales bacterium]